MLKKLLWAKMVENRVLCSITPKEMRKVKRVVFGSTIYAKVSDKMKGKCDVYGIKCVFIRCCKGMKAYKLMYFEEEKKIIENKDIVIMKNNVVAHSFPNSQLTMF